MALPDYQAQIEPQALPGRAYPHLPSDVSPQEEGAGIGRAIEDVGSVVHSVYEKQANQARETQHTDAVNQLTALSLDLWKNPQTGALTKQGKDAFGLDQQYLPQYRERAQAIVNSVPDPRARAAAQLSMEHIGNQLSEQLDTHEIEQHRIFSDRTDKSAVELARQAAAANANHPDILVAQRDTIGLTIERMGQRNGWSDEEIKQAQQTEYSKMHSDVVDELLGDDKFALAKHYLDANKADLEPHTYWSLTRVIDAHLKEKQNEAKADIRDRLADSMEAAQFGLKNPITVTPGELKILFPNDWERHWHGLQSMVQAGAQSRQYDQMTPQQIQEDLQKAKPTEGGPEAAFAIRGYDIRERAALQSMTARNQDPAQFAIDRGAGWRPLDFTDPQSVASELRSRAGSAPQLGQQIGVPVNLLTKGEAKQLADTLDRAKPDDQMGLLAALHRTFPDERAYYSVLAQIAPHSPVTAIAGAKGASPGPTKQPVWFDHKFADSDRVDAEHIVAGEQLLNPRPPEKGERETGATKAPFPMPEDKGPNGLRAIFARQAGDLFRDRPEVGEAHYSAFKAAYASLLAEKGDMKGQGDPKLAADALRMSLGHVIQFNGQAVSVPSGMDPTRFEGLAHNAVRDGARVLGFPPDWEDRIRGYQLREVGAVGSGRYELVNGNAPLMRPDGKGTFYIDLRQQYTGPKAHGSPEDVARAARENAEAQR